MDRRTFLATGAATALAGCLGGEEPSSGDWDVGMSGRRFTTAQIEVDVGTTVTWKNTSNVPHSVTAYEDEIPADADYFASGGFDTESAARDAWMESEGVIQSDETYEHTFDVPGDYRYFCVPHEQAGMTGTVRVVES